VAVHEVSNSRESTADPQLRHRQQLVEVDHQSGVRHTIDGPKIHLSRTPGGPRRAGPTLNEHLVDVLEGLLGYSSDQVADLVALDLFR